MYQYKLNNWCRSNLIVTTCIYTAWLTNFLCGYWHYLLKVVFMINILFYYWLLSPRIINSRLSQLDIGFCTWMIQNETVICFRCRGFGRAGWWWCGGVVGLRCFFLVLPGCSKNEPTVTGTIGIPSIVITVITWASIITRKKHLEAAPMIRKRYLKYITYVWMVCMYEHRTRTNLLDQLIVVYIPCVP